MMPRPWPRQQTSLVSFRSFDCTPLNGAWWSRTLTAVSSGRCLSCRIPIPGPKALLFHPGFTSSSHARPGCDEAAGRSVCQSCLAASVCADVTNERACASAERARRAHMTKPPGAVPGALSTERRLLALGRRRSCPADLR